MEKAKCKRLHKGACRHVDSQTIVVLAVDYLGGNGRYRL
jgi:hypothetical protein